VFSAVQVVQLRAQLDDDLADSEYDIAINLKNITQLDKAGLRFFGNLEKALNKKKRSLVFYNVASGLQEQLLAESDFVIYDTEWDFEMDFHEINPRLYQTMFRLADGDGPFRNIQLVCPLCGNEKVFGYILDKARFRQVWSEEEITPVLEPIDPNEQTVDFSKYQVAVCARCLHAGSRLDWFSANFPEGNVETILTAKQIDRLSNISATRKQLPQAELYMGDDKWFQIPREKEAVYLAWALNEVSHKNISSKRREVDALEIAYSNFMMCKYAPDQRLVDEHLNTAMAWLSSVLDNPQWYSRIRVAAAYTYAISVLIARDRPREAKDHLDAFVEKFKDAHEYDFYMERALLMYREYESE